MVNGRSLACFVVTSVLFGGTFVGAKAGLAYFPPLLFVALRFDIAALALVGYVIVTRSRDDLVPRTRDDAAAILATGLLTIGSTNALLFAGQGYVTSGVASIVSSLNPILTSAFAAVLLADERLSVRGAVGMGLGLVGVALVVSPDPANVLAGGVVGKTLLFAGAVTGALGAVLVRRVDGDLGSTVTTAWGLPFAALLGHGLSLATGESVGAVDWEPEAVLALAFVALLSGAVVYITYFGLLESVGAIRANLVFYATPVVATVGGWALLGETVPTLALAGFLTIFAGFVVVGSESVDRLSVARIRNSMTDGGVTDHSPRDDGPSAPRSD